MTNIFYFKLNFDIMKMEDENYSMIVDKVLIYEY